jgi:hypothetical protein
MNPKKIGHIVSVLLVLILLATSVTSTTQALASSPDPTFDLKISFQYDEAYDFSDGLAAVSINNLAGFINTSGELVIPLQYNFVSPFYNGRAIVIQNNEAKIIDKTGKTLTDISGSYVRAWSFTDDGLATVQLANNAYGFVDTQGILVIPGIYQNVTFFSEGLAFVFNKEQTWDVIDVAGKTVFHTDKAGTPSTFRDGYALLFDNGTSYVYDTSVALVQSFKSNSYNPFMDGWSRVKNALTATYHFYSPTGLILPINGIESIVDATGFGNRRAWVFTKGIKTTITMIDTAGNILGSVTEPAGPNGDIYFWDSGELILSVPTLRGYSRYKYNGKYGFLDESTFQFSEAAYSDARSFAEGYAAVKDENGKWGYIVPHSPNDISSWAVAPVEEAISKGIVPPDLQYKFTSNITRLEFCHLAVTTYETITGTAIEGRVTFSDTSDIYVQKAGFLGIISGVGNTLFNPNGYLTREQAAVILNALIEKMGHPLPGKHASFVDNSQISSWAIKQVGQIQNAGIMGGVGGNRFSPKSPYTREQGIATIINILDILQK